MQFNVLRWDFCVEVSVGFIILNLVWGRPRHGNASENVGKSFFYGGPAPFPGSERAVSRSAPFHAPRSPSWALAPVLSAGTPKADVWGGRGIEL